MNAQVFESIMKDSKRMEKYMLSPLKHAAFLALYEYAKKGLKFSDLPWFTLSATQDSIKKAA